MGWIGIALLSEGHVDDNLLPRILERSAVEVGTLLADEEVEVTDVIPLRPRPGPASVDEGLDKAVEDEGAFNILAVHRDVGSSVKRTTREWIEPYRDGWRDRQRSEALVMVLPVKETEAWAIADGDALREVFGVSWSDEELGIPPKPKDVERVPDPKAVLEAINARVSRSRTDYHSRLGELIRLSVLRQVPAFRAWEKGLAEALSSSAGLPGWRGR